MRIRVLTYIVGFVLSIGAYSQLQGSKNVYLQENGSRIWDMTASQWSLAHAANENIVRAYFIDDGSSDTYRVRLYYEYISDRLYYGGNLYRIWSGDYLVRAGNFNDVVDPFVNYNGVQRSPYTLEAFPGSFVRGYDYSIIPDFIDIQGIGANAVYSVTLTTYTIDRCSSGWQATPDGGGGFNMSCGGTVTTRTVDVRLVLVDPDKLPSTIPNYCIDATDPYITRSNVLFGYPGTSDWQDYLTDITTGEGSVDYLDGGEARLDLSDHGAGTVDLSLTWTGSMQHYLNRTTDIDIVNTTEWATINPLPVVESPVSDLFICSNSGLNSLPSATPSGGTWSGTYVSGDEFDANSAPDGNYVVTYTYTDANGCTNSDNVSIEVGLPNVSISTTPPTICAGDGVTLEALGADSYTWSPSTGLFSTAGDAVIASPVTTTTYTVLGTSLSGCTNTATITVTVNDLPNVTVTSDATDNEICEDETFQLSVTDAGAGATYNWTPSSRVNNPNSRTPTATINSNTEFKVTVTNSNGCEDQGTIFMLANPLPEADAGDNMEACIGTDVTLDGSSSTGSGSLSYLWTGTGIVSGSTSDSPTINISSDQTYTLRITDSNGCVDTDQVEVRATSANANAGTDKSICVDGSVQLSASGGVTYSWSPSTGLSDTDVSSPVASPSITTTYTVTVVDNDGCVDTDDVIVTVLSNPTITVIGDQTICKGEGVTLTASGANTYEWSPSTGLNNANLQNPIASPNTTTIYTVTGIIGNGCSIEEEVIVYVNDLPESDAGSTVEVCSGSDFVLDGTGSTGAGTISYLWSGTGIVSGANSATPTINTSVNTSYTLTVTDGNGCSDADVVKVNVTTANANAGEDLTICVGESVQLVATGGVSFTWSPNTDISDINSSSPIVDPSSTITYTVTVVDQDGCVDTDDITVNVVSNPTLSVSSDQTICRGESVILSATGTGSSYSWSPSTGLNNTNLPNPTASPSVTTIYTVTSTSGTGCEISDQVIVYVNDLPVANAGDDIEICTGESANLSASGGVSYSWFPTTGLSSSTISNPTSTVTGNTTYTVTVTDANGCTDTDNVRVIVNVATANAGSNQTICEGESIQLAASGGVSYVWTGSNISDVSSSSPIVTPASTETYTVTVTNSDGCTDTDDVTVTVQSVPVVTASFTDATICRGGSVQMNVSGGTSYAWSPATGLNNSNLSNPTASPSVTTIYTVDVLNAAGCLATESITITVNDLPEADAGSDVSTCSNDPIGLLASGGVSYSWSPSTGLDNTNIPNPTATLTSDQTYTVSVTNANGCIDSDVVKVNVDPLPVPLISVDGLVTNDTDICLGESVVLEAVGSGETYLWSPSSGLSSSVISNPTATVNADISYTVTITNSNGCVNTASVNLNAISSPSVTAGGVLNLCIDSSPYDLRQDVSIQGGSFTGDGIINGILFDPADAGIGIHFVDYTISIGGCSGTDQREIHVNDLPNVSAGNDLDLCLGNSVNLQGSGALTYVWFPDATLDDPTSSSPLASPTTTTTYTVIGSDANGCESSDQVTVNVISFLANAGSNKTICEGEDVQLNGISSNAITFLWSPSSGLDDATASNPIASPSSTTVYTLTTSNANGCVAVDDVTVTVESPPVLSIGGILELCITSEPYDLRSDVNISGGSFNSSANGLDGVLFDPSNEVPGIYFVTYSVEVGNCTVEKDREIRVLSAPTVLTNVDEITLCFGETYNFSASGGISYSWFPTDGLDNVGVFNPVLTAENSRIYTVTVTDSKGCIGTKEIEVTVLEADISAGNDVTICEGSEIALEATGGVIYSWSPSSGLSNVTVSNPVASPLVTTTYTVISTDENGCLDSDEITVNVEPNPSLLVGSKLVLCQDDEAYDLRSDVSIAGGSFSSSSSGLAGVLYIPSEEQPGIYFVDYSVVVNGCTIIETREIQVKAKPIVLGEDEYEICKGSSVQLSVSGGSFYSWTPLSNISDPSIYNPIVSPDVSTFYTVVVTDGSGCISSKDILVEVQEPVVNAGVDVTICQGESVELNASQGSSYRWSPSSYLSDVTDNNPIASPTETTTYTLTITDNDGCTGTDEVTIIVVPAPELILGDKLYLCYDDSPYDLRNDINISGGVFTSNSGALDGVLFDPTDENAGVYFVDYTVNINNCTVSGTREIEINDEPDVSVSKSDHTICRGSSIQLSASGGVSYSWTPVVNIDNSNIFNPTVNPLEDTDYTVVVTDINGCSATEVVTVNVNEVDAIVSNDLTICEGESIELSVSGGTDVFWSPSIGLDDELSRNPIASPTVTTTYEVTVIDRDNCQDVKQVTIFVNPAPSLILGDPLVLCFDSEPYDLRSDVNISGGIFDSESNGLDGILFDPSKVDAGIYFVNYTVDSDNCTVTGVREIVVKREPQITFDQSEYIVCRGDSIEITANGGVLFEWFPKSLVNDPFAKTVKVSPVVSREFEVIVTNEFGCQSRESIDVDVESVNVSVSENLVLCQGESTSLEASGGVAYSWTPESSLDDATKRSPIATPDETTTYVVEVIGSNGCVETAQVKITVNEPETLYVGNRLSLCSNEDAYDLRQDINIDGGVFSSESDGLTSVLFDPRLVEPGIHFVDYTISDGVCEISERREILVMDLPNVNFSQGSYSICKGDSVQIKVTSGITFNWDNIESLSNPFVSNPWVKPTSTTEYEVRITNEIGCENVGSVVVTVNEISPFAGNDVTICNGESYQLSATGGSSYVWDIDSSISDRFRADPIVQPTVTTTYFVNVTDGNGCTGLDSVTVNIQEPPVLIVGDALTLCVDDAPYDLRDDVNISGGVFSASSSSLDGVLFDPKNSDAGVYFVNYTITVGTCEVTEEREIEIVDLPVVNFEIPSYTICKGDSVQLFVNNGSVFNWQNSSSLSSTTVQNPWANPAITTDYTVTISDDNGCSNTGSVTVVVNEVNPFAGNDVTICNGDSHQLNATGGSSFTWDSHSSISDRFRADPIVQPTETTTYYVDVTSANGCLGRDSVTVIIQEPPVLTVGDPLTLCYQDAPYDLREDVSISGGLFASSTSALDGVLFDPRNSNAGVYFVNYTVVVGTCEVTETREITISDGPTVSTAKDEYEICVGSGVILDVISPDGEIFEWFPITGLSSSSARNPLATPSFTTNYEVTVTDINGCRTVKEILVIVNENEIDAGDNFSVCLNDGSTDLTREFNGSWFGNGIVNNRFYADVAGVGQHWLKVTGSTQNGCIGIDSILVTVNGIPDIVLSNNFIELCSNDDITDLNEYINIPGGEWDGTGVDNNGIFNPKNSGAGTFPISITLENTFGCEAVDFLTVKVNTLPNVYAGPDVEVCLEDGVISLANLATPSGGVFFGSGIDEIGDFDPSASGAGEFEIQYSFTNPITGCTNSDDRTVTVIEPEDVFAGSNLQVCINAGAIDLSLSVSPSGGVFFGEAVNGSLFFPSSAGIGEHLIEYVITGSNGCVNTASRIITVNTEQTLDIGEQFNVCANSAPIDLRTFPNIAGGEWSGKGSSNGFFRADSAGVGTHILTYEVSTSDGCALSETKVMVVDPIDVYDIGDNILSCLGGDPIDLLGTFNTNTTLISGTGVSDYIFYPDVANIGTHLMTYEFTNTNGCVTIENKVIVVQPNVFVSVVDDFTVCQSIGNIDLSDKGFPVGGIWVGPGVQINSFDLSDAGTGVHDLIYTVDEGGGCFNSDTLTIEVIDSGIDNIGSDSIVCVNSPEIVLNFSDELRGGNWSGDGVVNNIFYPSNAQSGVHTLNYTNDNLACDIAGQRIITVIDLPPKATTEEFTRSGCVGDVIRLTASLEDPTANVSVNYVWFREGQSEAFSSGKSIDFEIEGTENIFFTSVNQFGCMPNEIDFIKITANGPVGDFEVLKDTVVLGELVQFESSTSNTREWYWELGDGNFSTEENPNYYYWNKGTYDISLTISSPDDCSYTITKTDMVYVYDPSDTVTHIPLSINRITDTDIELYPNPVVDKLKIGFPMITESTVKVYDLAGSLIATKESSATDLIEIESDLWPSGTYMISIQINGEFFVKRVIKRKL